VVGHLGWIFVVRKFRGMWLGLLWIPLRPALDLLARGLVFGGFLQVGSGDRPYLVFLTVGMAAWVLFDRTAFFGFRALELHRPILTRTQVPWVSAPIAATIPAALDAALYAALGIALAVYYKIEHGTTYFTLNWTTSSSILGVALIVLCGVTLSLWTAPLVLKVPDFRFVIRYALGFWFFLTPVLYAPQKLPDRFRLLFELNPLTAPIELAKYGLIGTGPPTTRSLVVTFVVLGVGLPLGLLYVRRNERAALARGW
jgi:lipopolysaccharide transport system permease protein